MDFKLVGEHWETGALRPFRLWCGQYDVGDQHIQAVVYLIRRGSKWEFGSSLQENVRGDIFLADINDETWAQMVDELRTSAP